MAFSLRLAMPAVHGVSLPPHSPSAKEDVLSTCINSPGGSFPCADSAYCAVFIAHACPCVCVQAFMNVVLAICDPGDAVVQFKPYYFNHQMAFQMTGTCTGIGNVLAQDGCTL